MADTWQRYCLAWRLASPLRIGYRTIGVIAQTRLWVPGRNVWGALIDTLARAQGATPQEPGLFQDVQTAVDAGMRFEAWFLTPQIGGAAPTTLWYPHQEATGWYYGEATEPQMQRMVLGSTVGTAIEHGAGIAEEGMLFETEYIAPRTLREMCGVARNTPLWLIGHLWIKEGAQLTWQKQPLPAHEVITQHARSLAIGGEQAKGFGRLVDGSLIPAQATSPSDGQVRFVIGEQQPIPLLVAWTQDQPLRGRIEPIVGRTTTGDGKHGAIVQPMQATDTPFFWLPGSVADTAITLQFQPTLPGIAALV